MTSEQQKDWLDLGAGLGLLITGPDPAAPAAPLAVRIMVAMDRLERDGDVKDLEHVTALAIVIGVARGDDIRFAAETWVRLTGGG